MTTNSPSLHIPQGNVDTRKSRHENTATTVEIVAVDKLPDVLNIAGKP